MHYNVKKTELAKQKSDCLIVPIFSEKKLSTTAKEIDKISQGYITQILQQGDLTGECGQILLLPHVPHLLASRVLLVGCGKPEELTETGFRKAVCKAIAVLKQTGVKEAVSYLTELSLKDRDITWKIRQSVQAATDMLYSFEELKSKKKNNKVVFNKLILNVSESRDLQIAEKALKEALAIVSGMTLTKNLGNSPANICTPTYMAKKAEALSKEHASIHVKVLERKDMEKMKMGALLAVAQGSHQPPKLIVLQYHGADKKQKPVVLVGKGVTFDSGGISLKPGAGMEEMKFDMCGAASVLGIFKAVAELKLPINLVGVMPTTENLPGGGATKPGDIVTTMSGQTIEIMNTDAEGRLILSDALTYSEQFNPDVVIDIATLTGAMIIALGTLATGVMGNNEALIADLKKAGNESSDRVWELPLWEEYQEQIESNVADMANIGVGGAKSITAACLLARFAKKFHWAHLDIAGTAWVSGKDKSACGRPVPLVVQYLLNRIKKNGK